MLFKIFPLSKQGESIPLFKNRFLESLTHIHPLTPLLVFLPVIIWCSYQSIINNTYLSSFLCFLGGILFWSFLEYTMHRFFFHYEAKTKIGQKMHFLFHGIHHDYPKDFTRLVMPLSVSIPLSLGFYFLFNLIFGNLGPIFFAGMMSGYLAYDYIHFSVHYFQSKNKLFQYLKRYHLWHHYQQPEKGFGVSNPLWDYIFRSHPQYKKVPSTQNISSDLNHSLTQE
jgi:sterol desaturase/sphingolipid hydroxylase (fatty acid hydroxylase superfamily)